MFGNSRALFGDLCLTLPGGRLLPMLIDDLISPLVQLTLALPQARERARVR